MGFYAPKDAMCFAPALKAAIAQKEIDKGLALDLVLFRMNLNELWENLEEPYVFITDDKMKGRLCLSGNERTWRERMRKIRKYAYLVGISKIVLGDGRGKATEYYFDHDGVEIEYESDGTPQSVSVSKGGNSRADELLPFEKEISTKGGNSGGENLIKVATESRKGGKGNTKGGNGQALELPTTVFTPSFTPFSNPVSSFEELDDGSSQTIKTEQIESVCTTMPPGLKEQWRQECIERGDRKRTEREQR